MKAQLFLFLLLQLSLLSSCKRDGAGKANDSVAKTGNMSDESHVNPPPPRLVRDDGAFELTAVIDGVEVNRRFVANLKLVAKQREDIEVKKRQFAALPEESVEERAAFESSIKDLEKALQSNDDVMKRTYGYSLSSNFLLIPLEADLFEVKEGVKGQTPVHEIRATGEYDRLQDLRNRYDAATRAEAEKSTLADTLATQLNKEFGFNIRSNYTLDIKKGALYRKVAN